jgi:hypothetical protein
MRISQINDSQRFNGFNMNNVMNTDREIIKKDFKVLEALGKKYDITLISTYGDVPGFSAIEIIVRPLKDGLSLFRRLFRPSASTTYQAGISNKTFLQTVDEAIEKLNKK